MTRRATVILDLGKTHSKLTLWADDGRLIERRARANARVAGLHYAVLDAGAGRLDG